MSSNASGRPKATIRDVESRVRRQGPNPHVLFAGDWTRFGDMLSNDVDLRSLTYNNLALKVAIKEMGGISEQNPLALRPRGNSPFTDCCHVLT